MIRVALLAAATVAFLQPLFLASYAQDRDLKLIEISRKKALVIGNADYAVAPLKNPVNDATAVGDVLKSLSFDVTTYTNLTRRGMREAIDSFVKNVHSGDLALFYFAGHGIQLTDGRNYLIPVDFEGGTEADVQDEAYAAVRVQSKLEESGARLRIIVLDACRNNPFHSRRAATRGLAPMAVEAEGTLIAFSTGDNRTADDNPEQTNGLYTKHFLIALRAPGLSLEDMFKKAKEDVFFASDRKQNPSIYTNIIGSYFFVPKASDAHIQEAWTIALSSNSRAAIEQFLSAYPGSRFAEAAKVKLVTLDPVMVEKSDSGAIIGTTAASDQPGAVEFMWAYDGSQFHVAAVLPDGPPAAAGLRRRDVIQRINGSAPSMKSLSELAIRVRTGQRIRMEILRSEKPATIEFVAGAPRSKPDGLAAVSDQLVAKYPDIPDVWYFRALLRRDSGHFTEPLSDIEVTLRMLPNDPMVTLTKAETQEAAGQWHRAIASYTLLLEKTPAFRIARIGRGRAHSNLGHFDDALADLNQAIADLPASANAFNDRGLAFFRKKKYGSARADFDTAVRLDPDLAVAYNNRGAAAYFEKDYKSAIEDYNKAISLGHRTHLTFMNRGNAKKALGDKKGAEVDYRIAKGR